MAVGDIWMLAFPCSRKTTFSLTQQDAYRDYFRYAVVQENSDLRAIQNQQKENGAWSNPQDRWWRAGGKVYLTALSVLSQVPKGV
jgi:hypothetical protein